MSINPKTTNKKVAAASFKWGRALTRIRTRTDTRTSTSVPRDMTTYFLQRIYDLGIKRSSPQIYNNAVIPWYYRVYLYSHLYRISFCAIPSVLRAIAIDVIFRPRSSMNGAVYAVRYIQLATQLFMAYVRV